MRMPNFLIIGANKTGTTSLYYYLKQHPQIYMSPVKEPMFFILDVTKLDKDRPDATTLIGAIDNIKDYHALFEGVTQEKAIGEASTAYLPNPNAPSRIRYYIPNAKTFQNV